MAKVPFTKLALKKQEDLVKIITINDAQVEIKQYLPVEDKLALIANVLNASHDEHSFANPVKIEVLGTLEIIYAYTNINFTEKQKENPGKLYDLLETSGVIDLIINEIPSDEYKFVIEGIDKTITAVYAYENSVLGIMDTITNDYKNLNQDATVIQQKIANPDNLALLKDVLTKMG